RLSTPLVDALVAAAPGRSVDDLEDDLCVRFGAAMAGFEGGIVEDTVNAEDLVAAVLSAIDERLREATQAGADVAMVQRVLAVVAGVLPAPLNNVYRTRWAVVAPFASVDGPDRWYLWDVDTCGYEVVTVHSGFHRSAESAVAAWRASVGHTAAGTAALTVVDDAETLGVLLSGEVEGFRIGGENEEQYAEFLRSRRL